MHRRQHVPSGQNQFRKSLDRTIGTPPHRPENTFRPELGSGLSDKTIRSYVGCLEDAFLVERAERYDVKGRRCILPPSKCCFTGIGLRNARLNFRQQEENHLMESVLYNELLYQGRSADVGMVEKIIVTRDDVNLWCDEDGVLTVGLLDFLLDDRYLG